MVVHNETSTGVTSRTSAIRQAIDATEHPALLMVDTISSLASIDYRHDEWGVDVTVAGSQKGLMLPPGLSFNAISAKALASHKTARHDALLDLLHAPLHLRTREVLVAVVHCLELTAVDRNARFGKQAHRAAKRDEPGTDLADGAAIVLAEVGNRLVREQGAP